MSNPHLKSENQRLEAFRSEASLSSSGASSDEILGSILKLLDCSGILEQTPTRIIDVGCGQGILLKQLSERFPEAELTGIDYTSFAHFPSEQFHFVEHDCNLDFSEKFSKYDLVIASEVIEHLENPRHFVRQLNHILDVSGLLILSTPNLESWTSLLSFVTRGYHSAFGGKAYPAHITPVALFDLINMLNETQSFHIQKIQYVSNGRIPGSKLLWSRVFPFLKGKRYSDNYILLARKIR